MEREILEKYLKAGKIGAGARELALEKARPDLAMYRQNPASRG